MTKCIVSKKAFPEWPKVTIRSEYGAAITPAQERRIRHMYGGDFSGLEFFYATDIVPECLGTYKAGEYLGHKWGYKGVPAGYEG